MKTITRSGMYLPRVAAIYIPTPKNAAVAREIWPVGPENMAQLDVNTIYMNIVDRNIMEYIDAKEGRAIKMVNPPSRMILGRRENLDVNVSLDVKVSLFIGYFPIRPVGFNKSNKVKIT
jgi:hypothetical protein